MLFTLDEVTDRPTDHPAASFDLRVSINSCLYCSNYTSEKDDSATSSSACAENETFDWTSFKHFLSSWLSAHQQNCWFWLWCFFFHFAEWATSNEHSKVLWRTLKAAKRKREIIIISRIKIPLINHTLSTGGSLFMLEKIQRCWIIVR